MYCTIDTANRNSWRAAEEVGYHPISRLRFIRFLGLTLIALDGHQRLGCWSARRPLAIPVPPFENTQEV
jgi:RimJ/RimL family protein N-acetyltransferase